MNKRLLFCRIQSHFNNLEWRKKHHNFWKLLGKFRPPCMVNERRKTEGQRTNRDSPPQQQPCMAAFASQHSDKTRRKYISSLLFAYCVFNKVHIFWEGHKIMRNLQRRFYLYYIGQIYGGDFENFVAFSEYISSDVLYS